MKILKTDLKHGTVRMRPDNLDDLWHIERVLEPGDLVRGKTSRKTAVKRGGEIDEGRRRTLVLTIELEKFGFQKDTGKLRLTGLIRQGPEDVQTGSHHTIQVEPGLILDIKKQWKGYQLDRLKAVRSQARLFICVLDREQADCASVSDMGIEMRGMVRYRKVLGSEDRAEYYGEIRKLLESAMGKYRAIVLGGPGFEPENLLEFLDKKNPGLAGSIILEHASSTGKPGIHEIIKRSANRILKETAVARETGFVERLMGEIGKDGLAVYGMRETEQAVRAGALETLLVSEENIRDFEPLMESTEKQRGTVVIISSAHESGERFLSIGGIGGFLRFRI